MAVNSVSVIDNPPPSKKQHKTTTTNTPEDGWALEKEAQELKVAVQQLDPSNGQFEELSTEMQ